MHKFVCFCGSTLLTSGKYSGGHIARHRCSSNHREARKTYVAMEETTVELFFNTSTCICGHFLPYLHSNVRIAIMMLHIQTPQHIFRIHADVDKVRSGANTNNSCILCERHQKRSPPKTLIWSFDEIRLSYVNTVKCVANHLMTFQHGRFGRAKTSLVDVMVPDPDTVIEFDPAYILDSACRHKSPQIGVTEEQIFDGTFRKLISAFFLCALLFAYLCFLFCLFLCRLLLNSFNEYSHILI